MDSLLSTLAAWDTSLLYRINGAWTSPVLDRIMLAVSSPAFFTVPIIVGSLAVAIWGGFRGRVFLVLLGLAIVLGDGVIDNWAKKAVHRPRPNEALEGVRIPEQVLDTDGKRNGVFVHWAWPRTETGGRSFPSGHVLNNTALALLACTIWGRWRFAWVWAWVALVGYSRVYLGAHYPSDVVGSALLAWAYLELFLLAARAVWRRFAPKIAPKLAAGHPELY